MDLYQRTILCVEIGGQEIEGNRKEIGGHLTYFSL